MEKDVRPDTSTNIVLWYSMVHISSIGMVDYFPWSGVLYVVGNIIVHHHNDMIIRNTMVMSYLVGMTNICLVTIVIPPIAASNKENPQ